MFQYANGSVETIRDTFGEMSGKNELPVLLARKDTTIYFTKTHVADLRAVIMADTASGETDKDDQKTATT